MNVKQFKEIIKTEDELRDLLGAPSELARNKVISVLDGQCMDFIAKSPFLVFATANSEGHCDVSPRGDMAGFVYIVDENTLLIPERPGNKRADSMRNILDNPQVGLQFFIPGLEESLRINGSAALIRDEEWLTKMTVQGRSPAIAIAVTVQECFVHCAKALRRSELWKPSSWPDVDAIPSPAKMLRDHACMKNLTVKDMEKRLETSYRTKLY